MYQVHVHLLTSVFRTLFVILIRTHVFARRNSTTKTDAVMQLSLQRPFVNLVWSGNVLQMLNVTQCQNYARAVRISIAGIMNATNKLFMDKIVLNHVSVSLMRTAHPTLDSVRVRLVSTMTLVMNARN